MTFVVSSDSSAAEVQAVNDLRSAALLFDAELLDGTMGARELRLAAGLPALRVRPTPRPGRRLAQDFRRKLGRLDFQAAVATPLIATRRAVLGDRATAPPRFLVRVDEFPHYQAWDEPSRFNSDRFKRFHEILSAADVPYLLAVLPRVSALPLVPSETGTRRLTDEELAVLRRITSEHVALGLHGCDHRTRFTSPRRHSELGGLDASRLGQLLDGAEDELGQLGIHTSVFVAPYNRFDASQFGQLADRFSIVTGGPESVRQLGFHLTPQWRGKAVYLPSYAPFYGRASTMLQAAQRLIDQAAGLWVPIVLHWGWEAEAGWSHLERLANRIAPYAVHWDELHAAVARSRAWA